jgi:hypothetical protein
MDKVYGANNAVHLGGIKLNYMERPQSVFSLQKVLMDRTAMTLPRPSLLSSIKHSLTKDLF